MTRRRSRAAAASLALAVVLTLASLVLAVPSASALARTEPLTVTFTDLVPGAVRSTSWDVEVPRDAVVTAVETTPLVTGGIVWDVELCPAGEDCLAVTPGSVGARVPAGTHRLTVEATATDGLVPGEAHLEGRLVLAEPGGGATALPGSSPLELAMTGATPLVLALTAAAAAATGLALLLGRRRLARTGRPAAATTGDAVPTDRDVRRTP